MLLQRTAVLVVLSLGLTFQACSPPESSHRSPSPSSSSDLLSGADINPGRGYFQWSGMQVVPPHKDQGTAPDVYKRFTWKDLQADDGSYHFGPLTDLFDNNPDSRVSFRIRSMVDYGSSAAAGATLVRFVPSFVPGWAADAVVPHDGNPDVFIPDWNSEGYLSGVETLWTALSAELAKPGPDGVPRKQRIGWIDVGMYGQYGEWYLRTAPSTSSPSSSWVDYTSAPTGVVPVLEFSVESGNSKKRIVDAQLKALPEARWVMFFLYDQRFVLDYLFHQQRLTTQAVGWRFDGLGATQFLEKQWTTTPDKLLWWNGTETRPAFKDRWKLAPVVCEYYGSSSDPDEALRQIREFHIGQVGNGNFTTGSGPDSQHWSRVSDPLKASWALVGKNAGWRLSVVNKGTLTVTGKSFVWTGKVTNPGHSPAWEPWGGEFTFGTNVATTVQVESTQGFPLPGETLTLTLTGTAPEGLAAGVSWTWSPTIRGRAALWTGSKPSGRVAF